MSSNVLREAVLLKPKCYFMLAVSGAEKMTAKGLQYCVRLRLPHAKYFEVYNRQLELVRPTRRFQSTDHVVNTIQQQKWCLCITDTKRAWTGKNTSLPYGHYALEDGEPPARRARLQ